LLLLGIAESSLAPDLVTDLTNCLPKSFIPSKPLFYVSPISDGKSYSILSSRHASLIICNTLLTVFGTTKFN
jgi:hypothetical protein